MVENGTQFSVSFTVSSEPVHTLEHRRCYSVIEVSGRANLAQRQLSKEMNHEERRKKRRRRKNMSESRERSHWAGKWRQEMGVKRIRSRGDHREGGVVIDIQYFCWRQRWQRGLWDGKRRIQPAADAVFISLMLPNDMLTLSVRTICYRGQCLSLSRSLVLHLAVCLYSLFDK